MVSEPEQNRRKQRPSRPTRVNEGLRDVRARRAVQLEEQRRTEQRVLDTAQEFIDAGELIRDGESKADHAVASLQDRINRIRLETDEKLQPQHDRQATAAWTMRSLGLKPVEVAELLPGVSQREAARLIARGRQLTKQATDTAATEHGATESPDSDADRDAAESAESSPQGDTVRTADAEISAQGPDSAAAEQTTA